MRKLIAVILFCCVLVVSFSGCSIIEDTSSIQTSKEDNYDTNEFQFSEIVTSEMDTELNEMFDLIKRDAQENSKIYFYTSVEDLYYELKSSGLYDDSEWVESHFEIFVECNYEYAMNEEWYKNCKKHDQKSLNSAFYTFNISDFSNGEFSNIIWLDGLFFTYSSVDDIRKDYHALKLLTNYEYVTKVNIGYIYGLPYDYMKE